MAKKEESKKGLFDRKAILGYGLKVVQELLGLNDESGAGKATLNDIKMEDVQKGKIRLEHKESTILAELKDVEGQKRKLFSEGVNKAGAREQKVLARKIKELDGRATNLDRMLQAISVQMRVINNFIQIKEQERMNNEMGIQSIFGEIDIEDLILYMEDAMVDGELSMKRLASLADGLDKRNMMGDVLSEDEDVMEIVRQMQMAREAADSPEAIEEHYSEMTEKLSEKREHASDLDDLEPYEGEL